MLRPSLFRSLVEMKRFNDAADSLSLSRLQWLDSHLIMGCISTVCLRPSSSFFSLSSPYHELKGQFTCALLPVGLFILM